MAKHAQKKLGETVNKNKRLDATMQIDEKLSRMVPKYSQVDFGATQNKTQTTFKNSSDIMLNMIWWGGLGFAGLGWAGLGWVPRGVGWASLGWAGLGWAGSQWDATEA